MLKQLSSPLPDSVAPDANTSSVQHMKSPSEPPVATQSSTHTHAHGRSTMSGPAAAVAVGDDPLANAPETPTRPASGSPNAQRRTTVGPLARWQPGQSGGTPRGADPGVLSPSNGSTRTPTRSNPSVTRWMPDAAAQAPPGPGLQSPVNTGQRGGPEALPGSTSRVIWMWCHCRKCDTQVTPRAPMSRGTGQYSFGKFLEQIFYNHEVGSGRASCTHCPNTDHVRCFAQGDRMAWFSYEPLKLLQVRQHVHAPCPIQEIAMHGLPAASYVPPNSTCPCCSSAAVTVPPVLLFGVHATVKVPEQC